MVGWLPKQHREGVGMEVCRVRAGLSWALKRRALWRRERKLGCIIKFGREP